jgi:HSP20 family protein
MAVKVLPLVDIIEEEEHYILTAELPGVSKEKMELEVEKDYVTIKGIPEKINDEKWKILYREFNEDYEFERSFRIGNDVDQKKIKASLEDGVLTLTLPKREEVKPRKIKIQ